MLCSDDLRMKAALCALWENQQNDQDMKNLATVYMSTALEAMSRGAVEVHLKGDGCFLRRDLEGNATVQPVEHFHCMTLTQIQSPQYHI